MAAQRARSSYENSLMQQSMFDIAGGVHPGSSIDTMIELILSCYGRSTACFRQWRLRAAQKYYEGFYHLVSMSIDCSKAQLNYIMSETMTKFL